MLVNLKILRKEAGISQKQLADVLGITQQSVNKYENHNIEPDINTLIKMAEYFRTSVDFIIGNTKIRRKIEITNDFALNKEEWSVIQAYRSLSPQQKKTVQMILKTYSQ